MKTYKKRVAIIIVTFNRKDFVLKNLKCINNLNYKNYDVIVFDNGSTDGTKEEVIKRYPGIQYYDSKINLGGAGGFKEGMRIAFDHGYEYLWCLDDDGMPHKQALDMLLAAASKIGTNAILGTKVIPTDSEEKVAFWPLTGAYDFEKKAPKKLSEIEKEEIIKYGIEYKTTSVPLVGLFLHRSVVKKLGYPDEKLFISNDDVEYCLRAWSQGTPVFKVPKAKVFHPPMKTNEVSILGKKYSFINMSPWKIYYYNRNITYVNKNYLNRKIYTRQVSALFLNMIYLAIDHKNTGYLKKGLLGIIDGALGRFGKR